MKNTKIEWCDSTWNPVTGCLHGCEYCYARNIANRFGGYDLCGEKTTDNPLPRAELHQPLTVTRANGKTVNSPYPFGFEPTLHCYRLSIPAQWTRPKTIFVCSMADLFGDWAPDEWIEKVFAACEEAARHRYLFLTKNPKRYYKLADFGLLPESRNMWFGTAITSVKDPIFYGDGWNTFLSIEPLLTDFKELNTAFCDMSVKWIIIGAETGVRKDKVIPKKEWVCNIRRAADKAGLPVFMKDSLIPIAGEENMRREFPWEKEHGSEKG